jgi:hypothetical protein
MTIMPTFSRMRGDQQRTWSRMSDLLAAAEAAGRVMNRYEVRRAIAHLPRPTVKRYGHWHYTDEHLEAVIEAAKGGDR